MLYTERHPLSLISYSLTIPRQTRGLQNTADGKIKSSAPLLHAYTQTPGHTLLLT